ncbi:MAG: thioredoxin-dependent thiol peroxidase [bacterium]|nr:thioredoxin-dependent thiol peroxidase [bacterium]
MLEVGDKVPSFSLKQTDGATVKSSDWLGKTVVLYFYPKDDTPGCTKESCSLRDGYGAFQKKGILIYGISPDDVGSHKKFTEKFDLPFPLLADEGHAVADKFGVWVEKNNYGKKSMGIARTTFVIGPDGKISEVIKKVNTEGHSEQLLEIL